MRVKGKIAVITGGGSGCGRATAALLAREGARIICVDMDEEKGRETVSMIGNNKQDHLFIRADISRGEDIREMAEECCRKVEKVDILFNNAGNVIRQRFEETTEEAWSEMISVHLTGTFLCSKYLLPLMKRAGCGSIVNHASIDSIQGNPSLAAYSAAKGGLIPLTHVMAHDLAKYHIRVNCLCTGGIETPLAGPVSGARLALTPLGRAGTPEEVAYATLFLASDESSYITGSSIVIDGGRTAITPGCF